VLLALLFGGVALTYPFARDQGLFAYVGRGWFQHGAVPYRDMFEQKTPFIFALHGALAVLTGENQWAVRAADLGATVLAGSCASRLVAPAAERVRPGALGLSVLTTVTFYFGFFGWAEQANCEIWCVAFVLASAVVLRSSKEIVLAGALFGMALLAKTPSITFAPLLVGLALKGAPRGARTRSLGLLAAGAAIAPLATILYFASRGALGAAFDTVVLANAYHARAASNLHSIGDLVAHTYNRIRWFFPYSVLAPAVCLAGLVRARAGGDRHAARRWLLPIAFAVSAYAAVVLQRHFFPYHWAMLVAPLAVVVAAIAEELHSLHVRPLVATSSLSAIALLVAIAMTPGDVWRDHARSAAAWMSGALSTADLRRSFVVGGDGVDIDATDRAGEWVLANTPPDATLLVRGYEPQVYDRAHRRWTGRFFWSTWLVLPTRAYRRDEFLAEDRADFDRRPPDVVVAPYDVPDSSIESAGWFVARGYVERARFGAFSVLEKM
jgi:hypothetical protein